MKRNYTEEEIFYKKRERRGIDFYLFIILACIYALVGIYYVGNYLGRWIFHCVKTK